MSCRCLLFWRLGHAFQAAHLFQGKDSILSGPAGGIVGAAVTCEAENFSRIIGFDMGGTSTDVAHYDGVVASAFVLHLHMVILLSGLVLFTYFLKPLLAGEFERTFNTEVAGVRMRAPMMRIHTVAVRVAVVGLRNTHLATGKARLLSMIQTVISLFSGWWRLHSHLRRCPHASWSCICWCQPRTGSFDLGVVTLALVAVVAQGLPFLSSSNRYVAGSP